MLIAGLEPSGTHEHLAQEAMARLGVEARVPDEAERVGPQLERDLAQLERERGRVALGDPLGDRQHVVGLRDELQRGHEVGHRTRDTTRLPALAQQLVDVAARLAARRDMDVVEAQVVIEREPLAVQRMCAAHDRDEAAVRAWRNHAGHRAVQHEGRDGVFAGYRLRIAQVVRDYGLTQEYIAPYTPEQNGLCERFIRTLKENLLWVRTFATKAYSTGPQVFASIAAEIGQDDFRAVLRDFYAAYTGQAVSTETLERELHCRIGGDLVRQRFHRFIYGRNGEAPAPPADYCQHVKL